MRGHRPYHSHTSVAFFYKKRNPTMTHTLLRLYIVKIIDNNWSMLFIPDLVSVTPIAVASTDSLLIHTIKRKERQKRNY